MRVILTRSSSRSAGAAPAPASCVGVGAASAIVPPCFFASAAATTSSFVRRPSLPVPMTVDGSTPCSSTARRTAGDRLCVASRDSAAEGGEGSPARCALPASGCSFARAGSSVLAAGDAPSSTIAITAPTSTFAPTSTDSSCNTPATDDGTSTATLSVSRLAIGSSTATASPGCFSHSAIVPSVTDSPSAGTLISVAMSSSQAPDCRLSLRCALPPSARSSAIVTSASCCTLCREA